MADHSSKGSRPAVLVTGAASGIGRATAEMFLDRGAQVVAVDCQWDGLAREALSRALVLQADVSVEDDCNAIFSKVNEALGAIDTLVNCAGITRRSSIIDTTAQEWDRVINVNLRSVYLMSRQALKMMLPRKRGNIVNVASGWGLAGGARAAAYCASKGGVVLLTKAMALDHGPDGIRINCVCPGDTDTPMLRREAQEMGLPVDSLLAAARSRPLGRAGKPQEIAEAIAFLSGAGAAYITGTAMVIDGGSLAGSA